jgi:hypothetical protein
MATKRRKITDYIKQEEHHLVAMKPCVLSIDMANYSAENMRSDVEGKIWVKSLLSKIEFKDFIFDLVLDYPVELQLYKVEKIGKDYLKLYYEADTTILETVSETAESAVHIAYVERLIGGRELLKDASHLYRKLLAVYGSLSKMDSVHLEILCAQVLRDKKNINIPARLAKVWDPILINLKKVVFSEGFVSGLAFENINDAIKTGLVSEERMDPSIIEKVMTGTLVDDGGSRSRIGSTHYKNR